MDKPTLALLLVFGVHLAAIPVLVWLLLDGDRFDWRAWWPREDGDGGGGDEPRAPEGGPPLESADPGGRRLRDEHDAAWAASRSRRPRHAPRPASPAPSRPDPGSAPGSPAR